MDALPQVLHRCYQTKNILINIYLHGVWSKLSLQSYIAECDGLWQAPAYLNGMNYDDVPDWQQLHFQDHPFVI